MLRFTLFSAAIAACLMVVGCGGSGSGSPFGSSSMDSRGDIGTRGTGTDAARTNGRLVPVFLTVQAAPALDDLWITIKGLDVNSPTASTKVLDTKLSVRLGEFRDDEGLRPLFVGMSPAGPRLVRAQLTLDSTTRHFVTGQEKPVDKPLPELSRQVVVSLDPNAEFKDAMVLDLHVSLGEKGALETKLDLGKADTATDVRRQQPVLVSAVLSSIPKTTEAKLTRATIGGQPVQCRLSARYDLTPAKQASKQGAKATLYGVFDVAANCFDAYMTLTSEPPTGNLVLGHGLILESDPESLLVRQTLATGPLPDTSSRVVSVAKGTVLLSDEGKVLGLESIGSILQGRPVWAQVSSNKTIVGMLPLPKVDSSRNRQAIPASKEEISGT